MPGVPCDWLSETAIVLKPRPRPPAAATPSLTRSASSRWLRLQGIVPVHVDATPMMGPPSRAGSTPIARKCARAGARSALSRSPVRARRRRASTGASVTPPTVLHEAGSIDAHRDRSDARRGLVRAGVCPIGPAVVTPDEIPDPQALALRTRVNGTLMQDSSTAE